jgi:hypothetical protein
MTSNYMIATVYYLRRHLIGTIGQFQAPAALSTGEHVSDMRCGLSLNFLYTDRREKSQTSPGIQLLLQSRFFTPLMLQSTGT